MRYVKDILIEEVILDVLDTTLAKVKPLSINEVVETFIRKHIIKSLNSKDTYKAVFNNNSSLKIYIQELLQDQNRFKEISFDMARAYEEVSSNIEASDGDLLFVKFIADEQRCYALMKLEYELSYTHSFTEEEVKLSVSGTNLPGTSKALKKCLFFTGRHDVEMLVINKKEDGEESDYFIEDFIEGYMIKDAVSKTRLIKYRIEKWINRNLMDQIEMATTVRNIISEYLQSEEMFKLSELSKQLFPDLEELRSSFEHAMRDDGYHQDFEIDKHWIESKMKVKELKTDTGLVIKGDYDLFKDSQRINMKKNGDGTIDYIIKILRNIIEK